MDDPTYNEDAHVFDRKSIHEISPMFDEIMCFFEGKTKGQRMVRRSDFTPAELLKYLPSMALLELKADGNGDVEDIFCRVCGSKCVVFYGELTGTWLSSLEDVQIFSRIKKRCQITSDKCQEFAITAQVLSKDKEYITVRALYMPLSEDNKVVDKVIVFLEGGTSFKTQDITY